MESPSARIAVCLLLQNDWIQELKHNEMVNATLLAHPGWYGTTYLIPVWIVFMSYYVQYEIHLLSVFIFVHDFYSYQMIFFC